MTSRVEDPTVGEKALWPMVAVVFLVCSMLTIMVTSGVDPVTLLAIIGVLFTGISSLIGVVLYGKMVSVEKNTNGTATSDKELIRDLVDTLKHSPPVKERP